MSVYACVCVRENVYTHVGVCMGVVCALCECVQVFVNPRKHWREDR